MTWQSKVNVGRGSLDLGMYELKEFFKAQSWSLLGTGDGDSNFDNAGSDVITHSGSGANGIANTDSWWRIGSPDGQREYVFYRPSGSGSWVLRYSVSAGFTGGTPSANNPPTATDEQQLPNPIGSNQDDQIFHMAVQDTASDGFYSWWFLGRQAVTGDDYTFAFGEVLTGTAVADSDPCVHYTLDNSTITFATMDNDDTNAPYGYFDLGGASEAFTEYPIIYWNNQHGPFPGSVGVDRGFDAVLPIGLTRDTSDPAPNNWKGFMRHHKWVGASGRKYTDVLEDPDTGDLYLVADEIALQGWPSKSTDPAL